MVAFNDITKRTITGIILVATIILFIWIDHIFFPILLLFYITFANNEYFRFWHRKDIYPHTLAVLLPGYIIPFLLYFDAASPLAFFVLFFFVCLLSIMRFPGSRHKPNFLAELAALTNDGVANSASFDSAA